MTLVDRPISYEIHYYALGRNFAQAPHRIAFARRNSEFANFSRKLLQFVGGQHVWR